MSAYKDFVEALGKRIDESEPSKWSVDNRGCGIPITYSTRFNKIRIDIVGRNVHDSEVEDVIDKPDYEIQIYEGRRKEPVRRISDENASMAFKKVETKLRNYNDDQRTKREEMELRRLQKLLQG